MTVSVYPSFSALPPSYRGLLDADRSGSLFHRPEWYENFARHGLSGSARLSLFAVEDGSAPRSLLVGFEDRRLGPVGRGRRVHFTHPDHVEFHPFLREPARDLPSCFEPIASHLEQRPNAYDEVRFGPLVDGSQLFGEIRRAFVTKGFIVRKHLMFANWYDEVSAGSAREYLDQRSSVLQSSAKRRARRRKARRLAREAGAEFQLVTGGQGLQQGIADYVRVTAGSWQGSEGTAASYISNTIERAASLGCLRLGLMYADGRPATGQFWTLSGGTATCYRISYDRRFAQHSLGSSLTRRMIEHLIDVDRVARIDFGSGDETYKKRWVGRRRELWGLVAFNPRTPRGLAGAARHLLGQLGKRVLARR